MWFLQRLKPNDEIEIKWIQALLATILATIGSDVTYTHDHNALNLLTRQKLWTKSVFTTLVTEIEMDVTTIQGRADEWTPQNCPTLCKRKSVLWIAITQFSGCEGAQVWIREGLDYLNAEFSF